MLTFADSTNARRAASRRPSRYDAHRLNQEQQPQPSRLSPVAGFVGIDETPARRAILTLFRSCLCLCGSVSTRPAFVAFFFDNAHERHKIRTGTPTDRRTIVRSNARTRAHKLSSNDLSCGRFRQRFGKLYASNSKLERAGFELLFGHHLSGLRYPRSALHEPFRPQLLHRVPLMMILRSSCALARFCHLELGDNFVDVGSVALNRHRDGAAP